MFGESFDLTDQKVKNASEESLKKFIDSEVSVDYLESLVLGNEDLVEVFEEMVINCLRYTETVCKFEIILMNDDEDRDKLIEIDNIRKTVHDVTIDSINILARSLRNQNLDVEWVDKFSGNRAAYGRFAISLAFEKILKERKQNEE